MDEAHLLRSRLIEKCSAFEAKLHIVAVLAGAAISTKAPLGQKIDALQTALQAKPKFEKYDKRVADILDKATPLMALRNELAHGTMQLAIIDGEAVLLVSNAARAVDPTDLKSLMRKQQLVDATQSFAHLAHRLAQMITPPSPPQPKQAATTGP